MKVDNQKCPHSESGYECVDIVSGFCEAGEDCINYCEFSWNANDAEASTKAIIAFNLQKRIEGRLC
jgi:hypothetical protein